MIRWLMGLLCLQPFLFAAAQDAATLRIGTNEEVMSKLPGVQQKVLEAYANLGLTTQLVDMPAARLPLVLQQGHLDGIMVMEPEVVSQWQHMHLVKPAIFKTELRLYGHRSLKVDSFEDLQPLTLISVHAIRVLEYQAKALKISNITYAKSLPGAVDMLRKGRGDIMLMLPSVVEEFARQQGVDGKAVDDKAMDDKAMDDKTVEDIVPLPLPPLVNYYFHMLADSQTELTTQLSRELERLRKECPEPSDTVVCQTIR
ncbi:hypothetical protein JYB88_10330 [Shewanella cyperi]|uniref:Solute-binding protein family 3/N-terminal domain-containing protein n=1 Tax=Shewanella cyperi TaxID=2814292 RepID=A0A974XHX4_9GAMM|nr:hypothetical protein [Shewanella cyperi]QSX28684.1 hypothetical protein JYB88_10330 [Shewanella cyperi]